MQITQAASNQISVIVNSDFHQRFGLTYPVTYVVGFTSASDTLVAYARSSVAKPWRRIRERTSADFFNGEEAVRFDRQEGKAYVSLGFEAGSDTLFIRMENGQSAGVQLSFQGVAKYYDNRQAAVVLSADDWYKNGPFPKAISIFRSYHLWTTAAVITAWCDSLTWNEIQRDADSGFVEIASHTRHHPYLPYSDPVSEVIGSRDDILTHLRLPATFTSGNQQYVYTYVAPYGSYNGAIDTLVSQGKYIISRISPSNIWDFSTWQSSLEKFAANGFTIELGNSASGGTDLATLNGAFDRVFQLGGIHHLVCHPRDLEATDEWSKPYLGGHLSYISNRTNVWYTGFGHLYVYHLLQQSLQVNLISTVDLKAGWNMIAVPLKAPDMSLPALFPSAPTSAYTWDGTYTADSVLSIGQGYWLRSDSAGTVAVTGAPPSTTTIQLQQGWNLIGALNTPVSVSNVVTVPSGILSSAFYGFSGTYVKASTLQPGSAYWVKASQGGSLTFQNSGLGKAAASLGGLKDSWLTIEFRDSLQHPVVLALAPAKEFDARTQELPPAPPAGVFDVRFASNAGVASLPDTGNGRYALALAGVRWPLTVTVKNSRGRALAIHDALLNVTTSLVEGKSVTLLQGADKLFLEETGAVMPGEQAPVAFDLLQNYPNPFNPTTVIRYALPREEKVRLAVYNMLGQEVTELVNEVQQPGSHAVEFNARGLASGTYFYRLEAGSNSAVKKMLMVR